MKVGYVGLSHLGLVNAISVSSLGVNVVAVDESDKLVESIKMREFPVFEPGLSEIFDKNRENLVFSNNFNELSSCDIVYIACDITTDDENCSDLRPIKKMVHKTMESIGEGRNLVIHSQVPPGFCSKIQKTYPKINVYYQVETLIFGRAVDRVLCPERLIVGKNTRESSLDSTYDKFLRKFNAPIFTMNYESAELSKISINIFLSSQVTTTNTLSQIASKIGASWSDIMPVLKTDKRIGPHSYLNPGPGISGGNLERDIESLNRLGGDLGTEISLLSSIKTNSHNQKEWPVRKLASCVDVDKGPITIWGLSYKSGTKSLKNTPTIKIFKALKGKTFYLYDPLFQGDLESNNELENIVKELSLEIKIKSFSVALDSLRGSESLVIMNSLNNEIQSFDIKEMSEVMQNKLIIDPKGLLLNNRRTLKECGFEYHCMGEPPL